MALLEGLGKVLGSVADITSGYYTRKKAIQDAFGQKVFGKEGWEGYKKFKNRGSRKSLKRTQAGPGPSYTEQPSGSFGSYD